MWLCWGALGGRLHLLGARRLLGREAGTLCPSCQLLSLCGHTGAWLPPHPVRGTGTTPHALGQGLVRPGGAGRKPPSPLLHLDPVRLTQGWPHRGTSPHRPAHRKGDQNESELLRPEWTERYVGTVPSHQAAPSLARARARNWPWLSQGLDGPEGQRCTMASSQAISQPPACSQAPAPPPSAPSCIQASPGSGPDPVPPPHWGPESPATLASAPPRPSYSATECPLPGAPPPPAGAGPRPPGRNDSSWCPTQAGVTSPGPCCPISLAIREQIVRTQRGRRGLWAPVRPPGPRAGRAGLLPHADGALQEADPLPPRAHQPAPAPLTGLRGHVCTGPHPPQSPPEDFIPLSVDPKIKR